MKCKKIIIVFKTHFDIGFTDLAKNVMRGYSSELMPTVIRACKEARKKNPDYPYVWTMSAWPLKKILESEATEETIVQETEKLIQSGELVWHTLPYTTHTEFCGVEEYIRGLYYSKKLCKRYGKHFISAKMTDVPGHTRALASILSKADMQFLHLGCNPGCMPPNVPRLFFWQAPDESRVLTFYNKGGYGSSILPPEDWQFPVWLAVMQTNDNMGPHKPEVIAELINEAKEQYPDVQVIIGTMDDFYRELRKYPLDQIPIITGDLADTWIHGAGAYPLEVSRIRNSRNLTDETQKLVALYTNSTENSKLILEECYENSLLFGEHTWGLDVKITLGHERYYKKEEFLKHLQDDKCKRMEESWEEQREREQKCTRMIQEFSQGQINILAEKIDTNLPHITIFNGLGFSRSGWVQIPEIANISSTSVLKNPETGEVFDIKCMEGWKGVHITNIPALGYITLLIKKKPELIQRNELGKVVYNETEGIFENQFYRLCFDKKLGTIRSLIDKKRNKEWVDQKSNGLGQYQYDVFGSEDITEYTRSYVYRFYDWVVNDLGKMEYPDQQHRQFYVEKVSFQAKNLGYGMKIIITCENSKESYISYGNSTKTVTEVTLYDDDDVIDLKVSILDKQETPYSESGSILFPFAAEEASVTMNKMGQVVDIERDIVKDANHAMYCCENWMDVSTEDGCVTLICRDSPLNSVGENGIYKFNSQYRNTKRVIYNNLFNNMWGTNFPQWMGGNLTYHYRLVFDRKSIAEKFKSAYDFVSPLLIGYAAGKKKEAGLPTRSEQLQKGKDIHVLTMKKAEWEDGTILRIADMSGEKRSENIQFGQCYYEIWECTCLEEKKLCVGEMTDVIKVDINPYEIKTFLLKEINKIGVVNQEKKLLNIVGREGNNYDSSEYNR